MNAPLKLAIVAGLAIAAAAVVLVKYQQSGPEKTSVSTSAPSAGNPAPAESPARRLPKLLDLGSDSCVPCKAMVPVLDGLKKEYAGRMDVEFIDVWKNEEAGKQYNVEMIPTQIFFDADGKELFRHTGFLGKDDILAKWSELGVGIQ